MGDGFRSQRLIALIAAYVLALQAVLLPLSAVVAGPIGGPCSAHTTTDGASLPADGQSGCPCAGGCGMLCCVHVLLPPEPVVIATGEEVFSPAPVPASRPTGVICVPDWRPQAPRGPPRA